MFVFLFRTNPFFKEPGEERVQNEDVVVTEVGVEAEEEILLVRDIILK